MGFCSSLHRMWQYFETRRATNLGAATWATSDAPSGRGTEYAFVESSWKSKERPSKEPAADRSLGANCMHHAHRDVLVQITHTTTKLQPRIPYASIGSLLRNVSVAVLRSLQRALCPLLPRQSFTNRVRLCRRHDVVAKGQSSTRTPARKTNAISTILYT